MGSSIEAVRALDKFVKFGVVKRNSMIAVSGNVYCLTVDTLWRLWTYEPAPTIALCSVFNIAVFQSFSFQVLVRYRIFLWIHPRAYVSSGWRRRHCVDSVAFYVYIMMRLISVVIR